jgi:hypothetical protein
LARLRPCRFRFALHVGRVLAVGDLIKGAPFRFHPDDVPAMLMITSSPDSESSVTSVWRLLCHRPFTPAFLLDLEALRQAEHLFASLLHRAFSG